MDARHLTRLTWGHGVDLYQPIYADVFLSERKDAPLIEFTADIRLV